MIEPLTDAERQELQAQLANEPLTFDECFAMQERIKADNKLLATDEFTLFARRFGLTPNQRELMQQLVEARAQ